MTLTCDIVCSYDMAGKLMDSGWQKKTVFYWKYTKDPAGDVCETTAVPLIDRGGALASSYRYAPTCEEISRELPATIHCQSIDDKNHEIESSTRVLQIYPTSTGQWSIAYEGLFLVTEDTLANAAASMWIYLKANNLLES